MRAAWFFVKLAAAVAAISFLLRHPGSISIDWPPYHIDTNLAALALAVLVAAWLLVSFLRVSDKIGHIPLYWQRRKEQKGLRALTRGFVAIAAGDSDAAGREAKRAQRYLPHTPLKNLLLAQSEQLRGNRAGAAKYFVALMQDKETSFLGLRGLLNQALSESRYGEALQLARQAYREQPKSPSIWRHLFELEARAVNWDAADAMLRKIEKARAMDRAEILRHKSALCCALAERRGDAITALRYYKKAFAADPNFPPAAAGYAEAMFRAGNRFFAERALQRAFRSCPHPDVATLALRFGGTAAEMGRLLRKLENLHPEAPSIHAAYAEYALSHGLWGVAASHIEELMRLDPSPNHFRLLQRLVSILPNNAGSLKSNLQKLEARFAAPGALQANEAFVCEDCATPAPRWQALCPSCGAFNRLSWTRPSPFVRLGEPKTVEILAPKDAPLALDSF